jgi:hypothetical protein
LSVPNQVTPERYTEFNAILASTTAWVKDTHNIRALGLAGSWSIDQ